MRILLVDEDKEFLDDVLTEVEKDYVVDVAYSGVDGTYLSQVNDYDVMVVGHNLPDMHGVEVCKLTRVANVDTPIIYVSDIDGVSIRVTSLDAGADVYLLKSISSEELMAQVRALVRRKTLFNGGNILKAGRVKIDLKKRQTFVDGEVLDLRRKEFDLLEYLLLNKDNVISKEEILEHVWQDGIYIFSNTVEVHIRSLRKRLKKYGIKLIRTVRGFGYKIEG